jgi:hypothetical protein
VDIVSRDLSSDVQARLSALAEINGAAGRTEHVLGRVAEIVGAIASIGALFGDPISAMVGWVMRRFARRRIREAEEKREREKSNARHKLLESIDETFDDAEAQVCERCNDMVENARSKALPPLVDNCIALTQFVAEAKRARAGLGRVLAELPSGTATAVLKNAVGELEKRRFPDNPQAAALLWRGEDWLSDSEGLSVTSEASMPPPNAAAAQKARVRRLKARDRFATSWAERGRCPLSGSGSEWLEAAIQALRRDVQARGPLAELQSIGTAQPLIVVCGGYSAGKSTVIRRLLMEAGLPIPGNLTVAAGHETAVVAKFAYGGLLLVDTPGFQSGEHELGEAAAAALRDAALVLYVFNPNLLTGSPVAFDDALRGDTKRGIAGKLDRTLFVINRCDELGVDPMESPEEYTLLCASKRSELAGILSSRGLTVAQGDPRIMTVAGDPYGRIGKRTEVSSKELALTADWDGIDRLRDALAVAAPSLNTNGIDAALLDGGSTRMVTLLSDAEDQNEHLLSRLAALEGVAQRVSHALDAGADLNASLPPALERKIADELHALLRSAADSDTPGAKIVSAKKLQAWHHEPQIKRVATAWRREATKQIERWATTTRESIDGRVQSPSFTDAYREGFGFDVSYLTNELADRRDSLEYPLVVVGEHMQRTGELTIETAESVAEVQEGTEAAIEGGELVDVAGLFGMVQSARARLQEHRRERQRTAALKAIEDQAHRYAELQAQGDDDEPGPLAVLADLQLKLQGQREALERQLAALKGDRDEIRTRTRLLEALIRDAQRRRAEQGP